jgi:hypothetical protein
MRDGFIMISDKSTIVNHKFAVITIVLLLFGVTFVVFAEQISIGKVNVTDTIEISDKAVIAKNTNITENIEVTDKVELQP